MKYYDVLDNLINDVTEQLDTNSREGSTRQGHSDGTPFGNLRYVLEQMDPNIPLQSWPSYATSDEIPANIAVSTYVDSDQQHMNDQQFHPYMFQAETVSPDANGLFGFLPFFGDLPQDHGGITSTFSTDGTNSRCFPNELII